MGVIDKQKTFRTQETSLEQDSGELSSSNMGCCTNEETGKDKPSQEELAAKKNENPLACEND